MPDLEGPFHAVIPFVSRRGPLPFCRDSDYATDETWDSVELSDEDGDKGLGHLVRLFWQSARVEFVATGSGERISDSLTDAFDFQWASFPFPDLEYLQSYAYFGAIAGGVGGNQNAPVAEPVLRNCFGHLLLDFGAAYIFPGVRSQTYRVELVAKYQTDHWRLFYRFGFGHGLGVIQNPAQSPSYQFTAGVCDFDGLELAWVAANRSSAAFNNNGYGLTSRVQYFDTLPGF